MQKKVVLRPTGNTINHKPLPLSYIAVFIMDRRTPYTLSVLAPSTDGAEESRTQIQARLREFVLEFQLDNAFIYRSVIFDFLVNEKKKKVLKLIYLGIVIETSSDRTCL